jgi:hypothetical protein
VLGNNEAMAVPEDPAENAGPVLGGSGGVPPGMNAVPTGPAYLSSIVALAVGMVLAVGVSALFGLLGWGGELASQTAGAASGAAPLIIDGIRQRRSQRSRPSVRALIRERLRRPKLFVASVFGFAVLLLDSLSALLVLRLIDSTIRLADGNPARLLSVYAVVGSLITLPTVLIGTYLLAVAAGHRLAEPMRRWILLGLGIYLAVRVAMVLASSPTPELNVTPGLVIIGVIISMPLIVAAALLGARRARRTQAAFYARTYFRRLEPADQEAALALLDEAVTAPRL